MDRSESSCSAVLVIPAFGGALRATQHVAVGPQYLPPRRGLRRRGCPAVVCEATVRVVGRRGTSSPPTIWSAIAGDPDDSRGEFCGACAERSRMMEWSSNIYQKKI